MDPSGTGCGLLRWLPSNHPCEKRTLRTTVQQPWFLMIPLQLPTNVMVSTLLRNRFRHHPTVSPDRAYQTGRSKSRARVFPRSSTTFNFHLLKPPGKNTEKSSSDQFLLEPTGEENLKHMDFQVSKAHRPAARRFCFPQSFARACGSRRFSTTSSSIDVDLRNPSPPGFSFP